MNEVLLDRSLCRLDGVVSKCRDSFGIIKIVSDYTVETTFQKLGDSSTKVEISHYYSTVTLEAKLLNLIAKGKIARDTHATLRAANPAGNFLYKRLVLKSVV